jgi:hypothetical protein
MSTGIDAVDPLSVLLFTTITDCHNNPFTTYCKTDTDAELAKVLQEQHRFKQMLEDAVQKPTPPPPAIIPALRTGALVLAEYEEWFEKWIEKVQIASTINNTAWVIQLTRDPRFIGLIPEDQASVLSVLMATLYKVVGGLAELRALTTMREAEMGAQEAAKVDQDPKNPKTYSGGYKARCTFWSSTTGVGCNNPTSCKFFHDPVLANLNNNRRKTSNKRSKIDNSSK